MTTRTTWKELEALARTINQATGSPTESYTKRADGTFAANVGNFHISGAYGGVQLQRMVNDGGGVTTPLGGGYRPKRELADRMRAFILGLHERK